MEGSRNAIFESLSPKRSFLFKNTILLNEGREKNVPLLSKMNKKDLKSSTYIR